MKYLLMVLIALTGAVAQADIYKCVDADGTITYTDSGCPENTRQVEHIVEVPKDEEKKLRPRVPLKVRLNRMLDWNRYRLPAPPYTIAGVYLVMSVVCFFAIYRDKRKSIKGQWRTPEGTLHLLELLGGWPGGLIAQHVFRHKTRKLSYQLIFWGIVAVHGLLWADVYLEHAMSRMVLDFLGRWI